MEGIVLKLSNVETMTDANEATRCEFISAILHASIAIAKKETRIKRLMRITLTIFMAL
ncbi:hypothetical protein RhiirA5_347608 [Rhizophagus irregularis]|nr:hypothetical protein RhiirA5_347608 [Rhizophagus irregularis]PKC75196.1 hypothetical protein RhiirA1_408150 [Rhizophagus irregularis]